MSFNSFALLVLCTLPLFACQKGDLSDLEQEAAISAVEIEKIRVESVTPLQADNLNIFIPIGKTLQFRAMGLRRDGSSVDVSNILNLTWSTSNASVGQVNQTGLFTAVSADPEQIEVSAQFGSLVTDPALVSVFSAAASSLSIVDPKGVAWGLNATPTTNLNKCSVNPFSAVINYGNGRSWPAAANEITWSSGPVDPNFRIASNGKAFIKGDYTASSVTISATMTAPPTSALTLSFNVGGPNPTSIRVSPPTYTLAPSESLQFEAVAIRSDNTEDPITDVVTWSVLDPTKLSLSGNGYVTASSVVGSTSIEAVCDSNSDPVIKGVSSVTISENSVDRVEIIRDNRVTPDGYLAVPLTSIPPTVITLRGRVYFRNGDFRDLVDGEPTWEVRNLGAVVLNLPDASEGTFTTTVAGYAEVIMTYQGKTDDLVIKINGPTTQNP